MLYVRERALQESADHIYKLVAEIKDTAERYNRMEETMVAERYAVLSAGRGTGRRGRRVLRSSGNIVRKWIPVWAHRMVEMSEGGGGGRSVFGRSRTGVVTEDVAWGSLGVPHTQTPPPTSPVLHIAEVKISAVQAVQQRHAGEYQIT